MHNIAILVQYDGTDFFGFQKQKDQITIQGEIEKAISKELDAEFRLTASGRTDRGVHAACQIMNFKTLKFYLPIYKYHEILNNSLPKGIRVLQAWKVHPTFNSRFYPIEREYSYTVITKLDVFQSRFATYYPYELELGKLNKAAGYFIGKHDFTTFSKFNKDTKHYECNVRSLEWYQINEYTFRMFIRANRFVYSMVRSLTGAMLDAARGRREIESLKIDLEKTDRSLNSEVAPPEGLKLNRVIYPDEFNFINEYVINNCDKPVPASGVEE